MQHTRRLVTGLATYVSGLRLLSERSTGGTSSAEYCYGIWLRHLVLAQMAGLPTTPGTVAELGPGDSLGTGIAALLTGASTYAAVDLVDYAATADNAAMVDGIRDLLDRRAPVSLPGFGMPLPDSAAGAGSRRVFAPDGVFGAERLAAALSDRRVDAVRTAVAEPGVEHDGIRVSYAAGAGRTLDVEGADVVLSQAVLEHVDDLEAEYRTIADALAPGGFTSHTIDFTSHHFARDWNGHWTFSERSWALVRGRRRFAINREPLGTHLRLIAQAGLEVVAVHRAPAPSQLERRDLAERFRGIADDDLRTASAVVQAVKR
jgi:SAM-dependent methyltransferase